jgi:hypothetical protein|tara:strand:+ start:414 stop:830 length:417 start_codon:yes stop_codon:yes gene_type:complete
MTKYNGWSNYETWNFKLWLDNDETVHNYIIDEIKKIKAIGYDAEAYEVSNFLRSYIDDNMPNLNVSTRSQSKYGSMCDKQGFYLDILNTALRCINTYEVAESYLEDLKEDEPKKMDAFDQIDHLEKRALLDAQMNGDE